jgi:ABC-type polysaccharide/polyol phosphate transport system ATPase subunit
MKSTSTSDTVLKIENLDITYKSTLFHGRSLRDTFTEALSSPLKFLMRRPKNLELLKNISFELKKGDRLALVGVNGCGKTSLCRAIAGMHGSQNKIKVNGEVRAIFNTNVVIQPELSGLENANILVNLLHSNYSKVERKEIVDESLEFSGLGEFKFSAFKYYSKGMKARMFLSIVSAKPCDLLILDEVFDGADEFFNEKIASRIKDTIANSSAVIFISHSSSLIQEVCNRVIVLSQNKIAFDGSTEEGIALYKKINQSEG